MLVEYNNHMIKCPQKYYMGLFLEDLLTYWHKEVWSCGHETVISANLKVTIIMFLMQLITA